MILQHPATQGAGRIGLIDIGSNSLRLVVYDQLKRAPVTLCNEKVSCLLGKGLATSGLLNPEGVQKANAAIARFLALARAMEVTSLHIIATAAVREARNGAAFVESMDEMHRIDIKVISGKQEARLGAYGILSSVHAPDGISGDLGGASLELVALENHSFSQHVSLPLGPLRLMDEMNLNIEQMRACVLQEFDSLDWLSAHKQTTFYAIGGSFRALAKMHQATSQYPMRIVHEYRVNADEMRAFADNVAARTPDEIAAMPGAASKRAGMLIPAAVVLSEILRRSRVQTVCFSACGIREGLLYEQLSPYLREQDALLASAADLCTQSSRSLEYGNEMFLWSYPLFAEETDAMRRLRLALCLISEVGWNIHPEYRADGAYRRILHSSLLALTHPERVMLALAAYCRHHVKSKAEFAELSLLTEAQKRWSRSVGTIAHLAYQLSGGQSGQLHKTTLSVEKNQLRLATLPNVQDLISDTVKKRLETAADAYKAWRKSE